MKETMKRLERLQFENTYARLPESFFQRVNPTPLSEPILVSVNPAVAELIDLDPDEAKRQEFVDYFSGGKLLPGSEPIAMLYAGHQFGHYVCPLGDGRAILLGEVRNSRGEKWDLHLKGAGLTIYSRDGDGRAVLRSTIREYLCGEAMHGLGISTTRAFCIVGGDETVYRETAETGAILLRVAPSHIRIGSFEVFYYRRQYDHLKTLADYVIAEHFPEFVDEPDKFARMLSEVAERTGRLIAQWQAVGWSHGVMNTDNMSILGLTLDYGPFGFMEEYNPRFICNHSDHHGRYSFQNQPDIGYWNIRCLAQALSPLVIPADVDRAPEIYETAMNSHYASLMRGKLGLQQSQPEDDKLVTDLLALLESNHLDYTNFFRALGDFRLDSKDSHQNMIRDMFEDREGFDQWASRYSERLRAENSQDQERRNRMNRVNPKYVLRNYLAQAAISKAAEQKDFSEIERLLALFKDPYDEHFHMEEYTAPPPEWAKHVIVSCSS